MTSSAQWVIGNWKMNGSIESNARYFREIDQLTQSSLGATHLGLAVPAAYLYQAQQMLSGSNILWGAQDISAIESGARTSEISAGMLTDFNCSFSLIGHSERRTLWAETDAMVAEKIKLALANAIKPVICVGETEQQHSDGKTRAVIEQQISIAIEGLTNRQLEQCIFAYEPVWAIGTGNSATPEIAQAVHQMIAELLPTQLDCPILYGGSVTADNAAALFAQPNIDGALVGGASLNAQSLYNIAIS